MCRKAAPRKDTDATRQIDTAKCTESKSLDNAHSHNTVPTSSLFSSSNEGEEHVKGNLDSVEEEDSVFAGDDLEVDGMNKWPHFPGTLAGSKKIRLDLVSNGSEGVSVAKSKVGEENGHKDRAPADLVNGNLGGDRLGILSWDLGVEPVVEVMSRRSVVKETKGRKSNEPLPVEWSATDKDLRREKTIEKGEKRVVRDEDLP